MTVSSTAELPAKLEPVPPRRSVWRRALPWIAAFAFPALTAGVGAGVLVDDATLRPPAVVAPAPVQAVAAPVTALPALAPAVPTVVARPLRLTPHPTVTATPPVAVALLPVRSVTATPHPISTAAPTTAAAASSAPTTAPSSAPTTSLPATSTEAPGRMEGPATPGKG